MRPTDAQLAVHRLSREDYALACARLGRDLSLPELGALSVLWSEHCSYRSSRHLLARLPNQGEHVLVGAGENAGVLDIGEGLAVVFKIESHNHPSYIEPFQGAATGLGGILRDVFTMGARPIAALDSLRFGSPDHPRTRHLLRGVVEGIARYGNCFGVPTVGGELAFHPSYDGNCLVNVMAAGIAPHGRLSRGVAAGVGNPVVYLGARTGRDGIHGATMASAAFDDNAAKQRPAVQVGDPFLEKLLLEACLELLESDLVVGLQDMGAAGLTSSSVEMAARAGLGLRLNLDAIPTREPGITPYELLLSESQERMLLVCTHDHVQAVLGVASRWGIEAAVVGEVLADPVWQCLSAGELVCDLPVALLTDEVPSRLGAVEPPPRAPTLDIEPPCPDPSADLLALLRHPDHAEKRWVTEQYDHQVGASTLVRPGADAAVVRVPHTELRLALTLDGSARHVALAPRIGATGLVAEAARNLACVGARALGATDGLNLGSPDEGEVRWQLSEIVEGLREASLALDIPFVSGNVSLYNQTSGRSIAPTPIVGLVGLVQGPWRSVRRSFGEEGLEVALVGVAAGHGLGGSAWLEQVHGLALGPPPPVDLGAERCLHDALIELVSSGLVPVAHDLSTGGLALALAECCMADHAHPATGFAGDQLPGRGSIAARLFGEDHGRALIAYPPLARKRVLERLSDVPHAVIGRTGGTRLYLEGALDVSLAALHELWSGALPSLAEVPAASGQEPE